MYIINLPLQAKPKGYTGEYQLNPRSWQYQLSTARSVQKRSGAIFQQYRYILWGYSKLGLYIVTNYYMAPEFEFAGLQKPKICGLHVSPFQENFQGSSPCGKYPTKEGPIKLLRFSSINDTFITLYMTKFQV